MNLGHHIVLVISLAALWSIAVSYHDSWLRPWRYIIPIFILASGLLYLVVLLQSRRGNLTAAVLLFVITLYAMLFAIPTPSIVRAAHFRNSLDEPVRIFIERADGSRSKSMRIPPGESRRFTYFSGDSPKEREIVSRVTVTKVDSGGSFTRSVTLPLGYEGPGYYGPEIMVMKDELVIVSKDLSERQE